MTVDLSARTEPGFQRRTFTLNDIELRDADDDGWTFEGVACTVDHPYTVRDRFGEFTETIASGAFDRTLSNRNARVSLYSNHAWQWGAVPFASRRAGTLELTADPHLRVKAQLDPARPDVQVLRSAIKRGEMTEMSIGFNDVKDGVVWADDYSARTVKEAALREVSIVDEGANDETSASIRSMLVDLTRARVADFAEADVRRAIDHLRSLLDEDDEPEMVELPSGLVVTDEFIQLFDRRFAA